MSSGNRLGGKRVVITQADDYMGPATAELFAEEGASIISDTRDLTRPGACEALIEEAGRVDVLIANLASDNYSGTAVTDLSDEAWERAFACMVLTRTICHRTGDRS